MYYLPRIGHKMGLIGVKMKEAIILSYPLADFFEFRACLAEKGTKE